ncbi:MAG: triose-phosphate isomerase [Bacilli bacterium]|nr:triose-phosphate isomerase [Bacilli bacterium]
MRTPIIAGNWKMYKTRDEALQFIYAVSEQLPSSHLVESVICAPSFVLRCLVKRQGENLRIGAQNMHFEDSGAFTGEISAPMLKSIGVEYVVIGHSERRAMFNETDEAINKKLLTAFRHKITPILCIGESLAEREQDLTKAVLLRQLNADLVNITPQNAKKVVIAYEPIWAIGTGKTATVAQAEEACAFIRQTIASLYNQEVADAIRIQYGGSVKVSNIHELMGQENIDGALIGGASLVADDFLTLVKAAL